MEIIIKTIFTFKSDQEVRSTIPLQVGSKIFCAFSTSFGSTLLCIDQRNGDEFWRKEYRGFINGLALTGDCIALTTQAGIVETVSILGKTKWTLDFTKRMRLGGLTLDNTNNIYFTGIDKTSDIWCIDSQTGQTIWKVNHSSPRYQKPVAVGQNFSICSRNKIFLIDGANGQIIWENNCSKGYMYQPVLVEDFIVAGGKNVINVFDKSTGGEIEKFHIESKSEKTFSRILHNESKLYFGTTVEDFYACSINRNGKIEMLNCWKGPYRMDALPCCFGNYIHIAAEEGKWFIFDKRKGTFLSEFDINPGLSVGGFLSDTNSLYLGWGNSIYQLDSPGCLT